MSDLIKRSDAIDAITYSHLDNLTREERMSTSIRKILRRRIAGGSNVADDMERN